MTNGWQHDELGKFIELQRGFDITASDRQPGNIPVVASAGIVGTHSEAKVKGPGVVTGRYGTIGQVFYIEEDFWPTNTTLFVKDFKNNDPLFISYLLRTIDWSIFSDKSSVPGVNRNHVHLFKVDIPPLPEQRAIAHILGTLDDKIELNRKMNETLEVMARALFKSWFVDFDPVRTKAEGRQPAGMDTETAALFPDSFEDTALGEVPRGWRIANIADVVDIRRGASPRPIQEFMGGTIPWLKIADATNANAPFILKTKEYVTEAGARHSVAVKPGDLILSNSATCGLPFFVDLQGCIHDGWLLFSNYRHISKQFLYQQFLLISEHLIHIADGSVQKNLNTELVASQKIVLPNKEIVHRFDSLVEPMFSHIQGLLHENATLSQLRDTLLPKLMSGEVGVKEAEAEVERVERAPSKKEPHPYYRHLRPNDIYRKRS